MIKLCIDNTSSLHEFHMYEPYLYGVMKKKNCFLINDFSKNNSDIENFDITIRDAESILLEHKGTDYEVTIIAELLEVDKPLVQKLYEIDKYITSKFTKSQIQKTKNITIILLDYTGNSYIDFKEELYVAEEESELFFTKEELLACEKKLKNTKDVEKFIDELIRIRDTKVVCSENEWYLYIFSKMLKHFNDPHLLELNGDTPLDIIDIFKKLMSHFVKKEILDTKLILKHDMYSEKNLYSKDSKSFTDMNKLIALLSFDMEEFLTKSKSIFYKGIYNVQIGLDEEKVKRMIMQYSENLKAQLDMLNQNKPSKIEVARRVMPNISLRNIYLEPVKVKPERLTFFRSSRNIQYLDRIEKNLTISINKRIKRAKSHNVQSICDLRTLRYVDEKTLSKEKLSLIEIRDRIEEKANEYKRKNREVFNSRTDYYEILEDYLNKQKAQKNVILEELNKKLKLKNFAFANIVLYVILGCIILASCPELVTKISEVKNLLLTLGYIAVAVFITTLGNLIVDNIKINKKIDEYVKFVNGYNSRLQINSNEEIKKLSATYELIILNSDIEYYKKQYDKLLNLISKYEFHISQLEKHINIAKRLCLRVGVKFFDIVVANDTKFDEKNVEVDINKDVYENDCYSVMRFLFETKDYCMMLNSGEVIEKVGLETYIKSINFTEDEVYRF